MQPDEDTHFSLNHTSFCSFNIYNRHSSPKTTISVLSRSGDLKKPENEKWKIEFFSSKSNYIVKSSIRMGVFEDKKFNKK